MRTQLLTYFDRGGRYQKKPAAEGSERLLYLGFMEDLTSARLKKKTDRRKADVATPKVERENRDELEHGRVRLSLYLSGTPQQLKTVPKEETAINSGAKLKGRSARRFLVGGEK